jgi:acetolactate synthase I/II/III large subunit
MHPAELSRSISNMLPDNSIVMGDAGAHMLWLNCHMRLTRGQLYQNPGSFGPMASHVNGALGVKCADPKRAVICGCGDGDYLMAGFELLTAVQYDIPVIWVIFNNGEFNIIKQFMVNMYGDHAYMCFKNPDYVKYAEACGGVGYHVENVEEFEKAFSSALSSNRPTIIDAVVASDVYPPFNMGRV